MNFVDFIRAWRPTDAQRVLWHVGCDGVDPAALNGDDREMADALFGGIETVPPVARRTLVVVAGARSGKTLFASLRLLHLALTTPLQLAPGEQAACIYVAPDLKLAKQALRYAVGALKEIPALASLVESETAEGVVLRRGKVPISLEVLPAARGGAATRGRSIVGAVCDELAFFRDESAVVNDVEVVRSITPRIVPGGQLIIISTPWAEAGLLYELHRDNFGDPKRALVAHAPSVLLRPTLHSIVDLEREADPDNCRREFDAEFLAGGSELFFDPATIDAAAAVEFP